MPSNHIILCHPILFLPSNFPSIRVFSNESQFFSWGGQSCPSNEYWDWFPLGLTGLIYLLLQQYKSINPSALNFLYSPILTSKQFSSVQFSHSVVSHSVTPGIAAHQASLSITKFQSLPKVTSIEAVMTSSILILCRPLFLLPPILPSLRVFSSESNVYVRWPNIGDSASASVLPVNTQEWSHLGWTGWISLQSKGLSRVFSITTVQKHQFSSAQLSLQSNSHIHTWPLEIP